MIERRRSEGVGDDQAGEENTDAGAKSPDQLVTLLPGAAKPFPGNNPRDGAGDGGGEEHQASEAPPQWIAEAQAILVETVGGKPAQTDQRGHQRDQAPNGNTKMAQVLGEGCARGGQRFTGLA